MKKSLVLLLCLTMLLSGCTAVGRAETGADDLLEELLRIFGASDEYLEMTDVEPAPRDVQEVEVTAWAKDMMRNIYEKTAAEMEQYVVTARFAYFHEYMMGWEPVWCIKMASMEDPADVHRVLYTYDGIFLGYALAGEEFTMPYFCGKRRGPGRIRAPRMATSSRSCPIRKRRCFLKSGYRL